MLETILLSMGAIALSEIGDKTQLLALALAAHYRKPIPIVLGILCATPLPKMIVAKLRKSKGAATALDVLEPLFVLIPLLLGTAFLVDGSFNPFLYFRF